jgi:hypothetical protein
MVSHCACPTRVFGDRALHEHILILYISLWRSGRGCPLLRASSDHRFIVGALRARRAPRHSFPSLQACSFFSHGMTPVLVPLRPSNEVTVGLSKLARLSLQGWGLIDLPLRASFSPAHPLADIFHPAHPPIASQSISRDVPSSRARPSNPFHVSLREWPRLPSHAPSKLASFSLLEGHPCWSHCGRRASTF